MLCRRLVRFRVLIVLELVLLDLLRLFGRVVRLILIGRVFRRAIWCRLLVIPRVRLLVVLLWVRPCRWLVIRLFGRLIGRVGRRIRLLVVRRGLNRVGLLMVIFRRRLFLLGLIWVWLLLLWFGLVIRMFLRWWRRFGLRRAICRIGLFLRRCLVRLVIGLVRLLRCLVMMLLTRRWRRRYLRCILFRFWRAVRSRLDFGRRCRRLVMRRLRLRCRLIRLLGLVV